MKHNSLNDCEASASPWTQQSSRQFPLSESASLTITHTQSVSWQLTSRDCNFCHNGTFFSWVPLQIKKCPRHIVVLQQKKSTQKQPWWIFLVTLAMWHFCSAACEQEVHHYQSRGMSAVWEIPKWGSIFSLTDEAERGEWATPVRVGLCVSAHAYG